MKGRRTFLIAPVVAVAVVVLAVAGCGSSSDDVKAACPPRAPTIDPRRRRRHGRRGFRRPGQPSRRLAGTHALPVREGQGHGEHLLRRLRAGLATSTTNGSPKAGSDVDRALLAPRPARTASPSSPTTVTRSIATSATAQPATLRARTSRSSAAAGTSSLRPASRSKGTRPARPRAGAAMTTSASRMGGLPAARRRGRVRWFAGAYALGAALLAAEAAVHLQQYASVFHEVRWMGPCSWPTPRPVSWPRRAHPRTRSSPRSPASRSPPARWPVSCSATEPAYWAGLKPAGGPRSRWRWRRSSVLCWRWRRASRAWRRGASRPDLSLAIAGFEDHGEHGRSETMQTKRVDTPKRKHGNIPL